MYPHWPRLSYLAFVALSSLLLILAACSNAGGNTSDNNAPIEVGWDGPLTGVNADLGKWDIQAIQLAIDEVNAKGGIHGRQIHLTRYDDTAQAAQGISNVQRLISQNHIVACFCSPNSGVTLAVLPTLTKAKIVQITPGLAASLTAQKSAYIFRDTPAGAAYEKPLITYLVQTMHFTKFAQITSTTEYGQGEAKYQQDFLQELGLKPLGTLQKYGSNDTNFTGQLNSLLATNPEVLLLGGEEVTSGLIAKQARQLGFKGQFAGGAPIGTPTFINTAGDVANGAIFTNPYITNDKSASAKTFAAAYQAKWGEAPESHGAKAYDGAELLIQALNAAYPNITGASVATAMHNIHDYPGLQGVCSFDTTGEGFHDTQVGMIKNGVTTPVS
ncbi:MAG TPA: ABC transporter substrate-binding protein [Ktedonobacteraceae bacterium]|nr:ABC transporter substrate-binding protein [Ktedonobacteraceae bacterium]